MKRHNPLWLAAFLLWLAFWGFALGWDLKEGDLFAVAFDAVFIGVVLWLMADRVGREMVYEHRQAHRDQINGGL